MADVSPIEGTIGRCNYLISFSSTRNRTQEADGSIPFSSKILLGFFLTRGGEKTLSEQPFFVQEARSSFLWPPASTVSTFCWRAPAPAPDLA